MTDLITDEEDLIKLTVGIEGVTDQNFPEFGVTEVMLGESLKTPGLQTSVRFNASTVSDIKKNYDLLKGAAIEIEIERLAYAREPYVIYGIPSKMKVGMDGNHIVYRIENRTLVNSSTEEMMIRACDSSLIKDAINLVSKSWKCTSPTKIFTDVMTQCIGVPQQNLKTESSAPSYDYIAKNIHPFQVINQQTNAALAQGTDPSFLHFMTYDVTRGVGIHHFESLKTMAQRSSIFRFERVETGQISGFLNPVKALSFNFPCDFDLLTDALNGIGPDGKDMNSLAAFNPKNRMFSLLGNQTAGCGVGGGVYKTAQTNTNTAKQQDTCASDVEKYRLKRQARMNLIDNDKIALRLTVPFNPLLNVGKVITFNYVDELGTELYGWGQYLILNLYHHLKNGGYGTTVIDCVSNTVAEGVV